MKNPARHLFFDTARRVAEAFCFYAVVALIAMAIGFVAAVLVATAPKRSALISASLPAVAWEFGR